MTRVARLLVVAVLACGVPLAATAQEMLAKRVSLDLKSMAPAEAFKVVADAVGAKVTVDPAVTTPVDILVRNVSARTALTTMCESIGCRWATESGGIVVRPVDSTRVRVVRRPSPERARTERSREVLDRLQAALKEPLPAGFVCQNLSLAAFSEKLSEALKLKVTMTADGGSVQTINGDFSHMTLQGVVKSLVEQSGDKRVDWKLALISGGDSAPTLLIRVGGRRAPSKKGPNTRQRPGPAPR